MVLKTLLLMLCLAVSVNAEVVRIEVQTRTDFLPGKTFGSTGAYEKLTGKLYFAVDPRNSANQIITDIDHAPRNADGKVEFSSDFYMLKPKDPARGNGAVLYEVSNRGNKGMLQFFNFGAGGFGTSNDPKEPADVGDGFLMEQGYTLMWIGWQFDVPMRNDLVRSYVPTARQADGSPIYGLVRSDFVPAEKVQEYAMADRGGQMAYVVADRNHPANTLTVRETPAGARRVIPRDQWEFTPDGRNIRMAAGFEPRKIYEVVYRSENPAVVGLGPAAVRDMISKLKYGSAPELSIAAGTIKRAIGFGFSMSGRFLRTFLYYGYNEDESHRKVFDGVMAHVAGSSRGGYNLRFAQPSRGSDPFANFFYPVDLFPFSDVPQLDPETGRRDGLLAHGTKPEFMPKVMYTNSSHEYWAHVGALLHITVDGKQDVQFMPNVRAYLYTGGHHGVGSFPPTMAANGRQLTNPMDYRWAARKLLLSLDRWATDGVEPPPSAYPRIDNGTLVTPENLKFPKIRSIGEPPIPHKAYRLDYGPDFVAKGIIAQEPPKLGSAFPSLVPQVDADGNDVAGIRMPEVTVPLATYLGWNLYTDDARPAIAVSLLNGSFIPFARTRAEREAAGDSRLSVDERYQNRDHYLGLITQAANDLVSKGYLIQEDVSRIVQQAGTRWDYVISRPAASSGRQD
jgi:hypothetical protein